MCASARCCCAVYRMHKAPSGRPPARFAHCDQISPPSAARLARKLPFYFSVLFAKGHVMTAHLLHSQFCHPQWHNAVANCAISLFVRNHHNRLSKLQLVRFRAQHIGLVLLVQISSRFSSPARSQALSSAHCYRHRAAAARPRELFGICSSSPPARVDV